jgi:predicted permease
MITPDYFKAFGIPILRGRGFTPGDQVASQQVAVVNQSFEREFFPTGEALGKRIRFLGFDRKPQFMTVVGIAPDTRELGLREAPRPEVYANYLQHADTAMNVTLVVRGPASLQSRIERIVTSLNRNTALDFENMDSFISGTLARERFQTALLTVFAGCALLLAVVGVYGLLSYAVTRRTSEIGVRMALGANSLRIVRSVLSEGGVLVLAGVTLGSGGSLIATRALESLLYEIKMNDSSVLLTVIAGFAAAALVACYLPAHRASHIDPSEALRAE